MGLMDILNGMQNGPRGQTTPGKGGMSPMTMALLALLAYKAYQKYAQQHPGATPAAAPAGAPQDGGMNAGLGGGLGGLLGGLLGGGAAGGALSGGLNDLMRQFEQGGLGDIAKSWIGTGANQSVSPGDLGKVLDTGMLSHLAQQFGVPKDELLKGLSQQMPELVDKLTPHGRVPDEHEMSRML